ncbi:Acetyl-CoA ligase/synthetase II (AMP-forming) subunit A [Candidatus Methanoliparum sp. LAM-1]|nr:Acetyl-CoA ligase/synthetase II (AMP-forming) subunit A [Candidatus Methanoliparum sp. LAM-1]
MMTVSSKIFDELDKLFYPKSIALFGASNKIKIGTISLLTILAGDYKGKIYPIHPRDESILGIKAYPRLKDLPKQVDLAIISVPAKNVPSVMEDCVDNGVSSAIIYSSNFSEVGEEGRRLEEEVIRIARKGGIHFVGPNCMGIVNTSINLYALMNLSIPRKGDVSMVSQSGTLGTISMMNASSHGVGLNKFVSSGNEADLKMEDYIEYLIEDEDTRVIVAFIEGTRSGKRFIDVAEKATDKKPFIVLKGGTTTAGSRAAHSHTGSMAGSDKIYDAFFRQKGVIRADDEQDMVNLTKGFSRSILPRGKNVAIYTAGGGFGVLASDTCEKNGLNVAKLSNETIKKLNKILPPFWSHGNPVDITASGGMNFDSRINIESIEILLAAEEVDSVIFMEFNPNDYTNMMFREIPNEDIRNVIRMALDAGLLNGKSGTKEIIELKERYNKPMICVNISGRYSKDDKILEDSGVPVYLTTSDAARVLSKLLYYNEFINKKRQVVDIKERITK